MLELVDIGLVHRVQSRGCPNPIQVDLGRPSLCQQASLQFGGRNVVICASQRFDIPMADGGNGDRDQQNGPEGQCESSADTNVVHGVLKEYQEQPRSIF